MIIYHVLIPDSAAHAKQLKQMGYSKHKTVKIKDEKYSLYVKEVGNIKFNEEFQMQCIDAPTFIMGWLAIDLKKNNNVGRPKRN